MEAEKEKESVGLLDKILPPRLEDAGLEDCALPAESIHEAFLKAASAVKSRAATLFHADDDDEEEEEEEPGCLEDPSPDNAKGDALIGVMPRLPDGFDEVVVGGVPEPDASGKCVVGKGGPGDVAVAGDKVVIGGDVVDADKGEGADCFDDGLKGLSIREKGKRNSEKEDEDEKPILVEGFV
ncbi:hypothetical protein SLE2022_383070 [Rubroshorea leprosula]